MGMADYYYYGTADHKRSVAEVLDQIWEMPEPTISIDTETIDLKNRNGIGIGIGVGKDDSLYFPLFPTESDLIPWDILTDPSVKKIIHNATFDLHVMGGRIDETNIDDTTTMAHLLGLPAVLSELVYHQELPCEVHTVKEVLDEHHVKNMMELDESVVARKCCQDCIATNHVYDRMRPMVDWEYFQREMKLLPILMKMSRRGLLVDQEYRGELEIELEAEVAYYKKLVEGEGFNPASPQQVGYILTKRGNWLPLTKSKKNIRTDEKTIEKLTDPMAALVLNFRENNKLLTTYVRPLRGKERAFTRFHLDAITGRISSTERNMQNIPEGRARNMFLPDTGVFSDWDFSQIELRILAHLSRDKHMMDVFDRGESIHRATAEYCNIPYKVAKNTGFSMIYGGTLQTVMDTAKIRDAKLAASYIETWKRRYPEAWDWILGQQQMGLLHGYVDTLDGRRIMLPDTMQDSEDGIRRKAVNYPIQGSAAEIMKKGLILIDGQITAPIPLIVHDEYIFDGVVDVMPDGIEWLGPLHTPMSKKYLPRWE